MDIHILHWSHDSHCAQTIKNVRKEIFLVYIVSPECHACASAHQLKKGLILDNSEVCAFKEVTKQMVHSWMKPAVAYSAPQAIELETDLLHHLGSHG